MRKIDIKSTRVIQSLITFLLWLAAALVMSGCVTHTKPATIQQQTVIEGASKKRTTTPLPAFKNVYQKKAHFLAFMKPIIVTENKKISELRQQIIQLQSKKKLSNKDAASLKYISATYGITMATTPNSAFWSALLNRVNIIPLELALMQAANESAWGTSRFARNGNNYFGQWCFKKGCGIVPKHRSHGAAHEVRRFKDAAESVRAYMKNINTSRAYADLRKIRSKLQKRKLPIKAELLANGLKHYSERGMEYVKTIRSMIRSNKDLFLKQNPSD
ncbi:MAG: glucosaminidase domain-containing protein [Mariprofundaceae bacterium]